MRNYQLGSFLTRYIHPLALLSRITRAVILKKNGASRCDKEPRDQDFQSIYHSSADRRYYISMTLIISIDFLCRKYVRSLLYTPWRSKDDTLLEPATMTLTATEFNQCCAKFVDKYSDRSRASQSLEVMRNGYTGWRWIPHSVRHDAFLDLKQLISVVLACF